MAERASQIDDLTAVLRRLRLQEAWTQSPSEVTQAQIELLLARIASLTETLRGAASDGSSRTAARLLLADLAMVAAQFRGNTNALGKQLTHVLENVRLTLESAADKPSPAD